MTTTTRRGDLVCTRDGRFGLVLDTPADQPALRLVMLGDGRREVMPDAGLTPQGSDFGTLGTANFAEALCPPRAAAGVAPAGPPADRDSAVVPPTARVTVHAQGVVTILDDRGSHPPDGRTDPDAESLDVSPAAAARVIAWIRNAADVGWRPQQHPDGVAVTVRLPAWQMAQWDKHAEFLVCSLPEAVAMAAVYQGVCWFGSPARDEGRPQLPLVTHAIAHGLVLTIDRDPAASSRAYRGATLRGPGRD